MGMCLETAVPAHVSPAEGQTSSLPACRHCCRGKVNRPRGLCWTCYYTPGVREQYEQVVATATTKRLAQDRAEPIPAVPTPHRPGTREKLLVFCARLLAGESLWHPLDMK